MASFSVDEIKVKSESKLIENKNVPDDSRMIYLEALMDWSDYYTENLSSNDISDEERMKIKASIVDLWIQFSKFEMSLHQFKKAVQVFDDALNDPIASKSVKIYLSYADFCVDRKKLSNAQKVYIKGLCAGLDDEENEILWDKFLKLMHKINQSFELTVEQLHNAVKMQINSTDLINLAKLPKKSIVNNDPSIIIASSSSSSSSTIIDNASAIFSSETNLNTSILTSNSNVNLDPIIGRKDTVNPFSDSIIQSGYLSIHYFDSSPSEVTDAQKKRESFEIISEIESKNDDNDNFQQFPVDASHGGVVPTEVLNHQEDIQHMEVVVPNIKSEKPISLSKEISLPLSTEMNDDLDTVHGLTPEQVIRVFDKRPLMIFTAPNKEPMSSGLMTLSNSSVNEIEKFLGVQLSSLSKLCSEHLKVSSHRNVEMIPYSVHLYLNILEALWVSQALKERHFDCWIADLRAIQQEEEREFKRSLMEKEKELNKAGITMTAAERSQFEMDFQKFLKRCEVQKELLHSIINKTLFTLLLEQETVLARMGFPTFSLAIVEKLESFLRNRLDTIRGISNMNDYDPSLQKDLALQRITVCAILSVRLGAVNDERNKVQSHRIKLQRSGSIENQPRRIMAQNDNGSHNNAGPLQRRESSEDMSMDDMNDVDGMKRRRKRRLTNGSISSENYSGTNLNSYSGLNPNESTEGSLNRNSISSNGNQNVVNRGVGTQNIGMATSSNQRSRVTQKNSNQMYQSRVAGTTIQHKGSAAQKNSISTNNRLLQSNQLQNNAGNENLLNNQQASANLLEQIAFLLQTNTRK